MQQSPVVQKYITRVLEPVHLTVFRDANWISSAVAGSNSLDKEFDWAYEKELSITVSDISSIMKRKRPVEPMGDVGTSRTITFRTKRID